MTRFVQLHVLTSYPPANLNRDDTGRPKTALLGQAQRLRISSQSLKRAWRTSELFETEFAGHMGQRTKRLGKTVYQQLLDAGVAEKNARAWARSIAAAFGKLKSEKKTENNEDLEIEQLAHIAPEELKAVDDLVQLVAARKTEPSEKELQLLSDSRSAVDVALFGRMLAANPQFNVEAAVQVAHAITVHRAEVETDYFTAVDDINEAHESGSSHIGERGYGAGVFYLYVCIDRELLAHNLPDDALRAKSLEALLRTLTQVGPGGMQNSFGSRAYAAYVLAEKGTQQPRALTQAFVPPVTARADENLISKAIAALEQACGNLDAVYGPCADSRQTMNTVSGQGSLDALVQFVQS